MLCPPLSGAGLLFRPEFDDSCAPPSGVGLLIRPEVMFLVPPGSVHDVLYAPCGLHNML